MMGPAGFTIDGQEYAYKRMLMEILMCQTCSGIFVTHLPTGIGALMTEKETSELCAGCQEISRNLDVTNEDGSKPS